MLWIGFTWTVGGKKGNFDLSLDDNRRIWSREKSDGRVSRSLKYYSHNVGE